MSCDFTLTVMKAGRNRTLAAIADLTDEQMLAIPAPYRNNVLWNLGHIVYVQYALSLGPAGIPLPVPADFKTLYMRGSSPADWPSPPSVEDVKTHLATSVDTIEEAFRSGRLEGYKPYELATGLTLASAEDAFNMLNFHEGIHLGVVMSIKKLIA